MLFCLTYFSKNVYVNLINLGRVYQVIENIILAGQKWKTTKSRPAQNVANETTQCGL